MDEVKERRRKRRGGRVGGSGFITDVLSLGQPAAFSPAIVEV